MCLWTRHFPASYWPSAHCAHCVPSARWLRTPARRQGQQLGVERLAGFQGSIRNHFILNYFMFLGFRISAQVWVVPKKWHIVPQQPESLKNGVITAPLVIVLPKPCWHMLDEKVMWIAKKLPSIMSSWHQLFDILVPWFSLSIINPQIFKGHGLKHWSINELASRKTKWI